jgi:hypothetical protein
MHAKVLWNIRDWANAVAEMPVQGPLHSRAVMVPRVFDSADLDL